VISAYLDSNILIFALIGSTHSAPVVLVDSLASGRAATLVEGKGTLHSFAHSLLHGFFSAFIGGFRLFL
jgi:hypothetical protein